MYFQQAYRCLENFWASKDVLKSCLNRPLKRSLFLITDAMDENKRADSPRELSKPTGKRCVAQVFLASQPIHETHHIKPVDRRIGLQYKNGEYRKINTTFFKNQYSTTILILGEKSKITSLRRRTGFFCGCAWSAMSWKNVAGKVPHQRKCSRHWNHFLRRLRVNISIHSKDEDDVKDSSVLSVSLCYQAPD